MPSTSIYTHTTDTSFLRCSHEKDTFAIQLTMLPLLSIQFRASEISRRFSFNDGRGSFPWLTYMRPWWCPTTRVQANYERNSLFHLILESNSAWRSHQLSNSSLSRAFRSKQKLSYKTRWARPLAGVDTPDSDLPQLPEATHRSRYVVFKVFFLLALCWPSDFFKRLNPSIRSFSLTPLIRTPRRKRHVSYRTNMSVALRRVYTRINLANKDVPHADERRVLHSWPDGVREVFLSAEGCAEKE